VTEYMLLWSQNYNGGLLSNTTTPKSVDTQDAGRPSNLFHKVTGGPTCHVTLVSTAKPAMCLRTKAQKRKPFGELHPLPIPEA
jgi:hypothetical protein